MSIKIIADSRDDFPENIRSEAKEVDGKYELDGAGVLKKNKELLGKNATLVARAEEAEAAKDAAEAAAQEWKGKAKIPSGQKLVAEDVAELGEAAKAAELTKDEMPTLKTAKADLQGKIDTFEGEKVIGEIALAKNLNNRWQVMAKDKNLKFEKTTEKVDGKDAFDYVVLNADGTKTKVEDFNKTDGYFKEFAETFKQEKNSKPGNSGDPDFHRQTEGDAFKQEIAAQGATGRYNSL